MKLRMTNPINPTDWHQVATRVSETAALIILESVAVADEVQRAGLYDLADSCPVKPHPPPPGAPVYPDQRKRSYV